MLRWLAAADGLLVVRVEQAELREGAAVEAIQLQ
jgi:molybdopterin biosynthesis enzyme